MHFTIDPAVVATAQALALAERASTFAVLLSMFGVVATEISGRSDNVVMTMTAGRPSRAFHEAVGPYMDFLPVRVLTDPAASVRDVVLEARRATLRSLTHDVGQLFVEEAAPGLMRPATSGDRLDFVFGYESFFVDQDPDAAADWAVPIRRPEDDDTGAPEGVIWTVGVLEDGQLVGRVQFDPTELAPETVDRWVARYLTVLEAATADPDQPTSRL